MVQQYERYMYFGKVQGNIFLLTVNHWQTDNYTLRINNVFEYVRIHRRPVQKLAGYCPWTVLLILSLQIINYLTLMTTNDCKSVVNIKELTINKHTI